MLPVQGRLDTAFLLCGAEMHMHILFQHNVSTVLGENYLLQNVVIDNQYHYDNNKN